MPYHAARCLALSGALLLCACRPASEAPRSLLITGATLVDGTGAAPRVSDLRIAGERIAAVGDLEQLPDEPIVEAEGLVLAPGFIDTHSHADSGLFDEPQAIAVLSQGITTVVVGQDGGSPHPLADFFAGLEAEPAAINVAAYAGHGTLRRRVLGEDFRRPAEEEEVAAMAALLRTEMEAGALGLSSGLEYDPGIYATTEEVVALAQVAAGERGRYISHIRSEDRYFWQAVEEILTIARQADLPVQISHLKLAMQDLVGETDRLLDVLDRARAEGLEVTSDLYPYPFWQSTLTVMFPERDFENLESARFAVEQLATPEGMLVATFRPEPAYRGRTLAEIAELRGTDPAVALIDLIRLAQEMRQTADDENLESVIATSMDEADIERLMQWPHLNFCTDGALRGAHPRGFGSFPRILGRYVRERGVLSLEQAVHKMSGLAAEHMGLADLGRIAPDLIADLVLFDPHTVIDRATTEEPHALSRGVVKVWVGGELAYDQGRVTAAPAGRVLRRGESPTGRGEPPGYASSRL